jgi:hypothetical protein
MVALTIVETKTTKSLSLGWAEGKRRAAKDASVLFARLMEARVVECRFAQREVAEGGISFDCVRLVVGVS